MLGAPFVAGAAATGALAWSGNPLALVLSMIFPALWAFAPSRAVAALVALAYILAASHGLPTGASVYFDSALALGLALWLGAGVIFAAVHAVLWTRRGGWHKPVRYGIVALLMSVPPFGIVGGAQPITAAGILFPGWGWLGLCITAGLLLAMTTRVWPVAAAVAALASGWALASWTPPAAPQGWVGIETTDPSEGGDENSDYFRQLEATYKVRAAARAGGRVAVLPENAMVYWTEASEQLWIDELAGVDIAVIGAGYTVDAEGYDNVMVGLSGQSSEILYRQRMPIPVSMWQPWADESAHAYFFENPVFDFAGLTVAPLTCYEQIIVWPVLQSMLFDPDVVVAIANGWWAGDTNIPDIQRSAAQAWASLFGTPLVMAFNNPGGPDD